MQIHKAKNLIIATLLSILVFFSLSFLTVLTQINTPILGDRSYELKIGFPFVYYHEFNVGNPFPNSAWNPGYLVLDCLITWIVVSGLYLIVKREKSLTF